jgi:hypothetical protein
MNSLYIQLFRHFELFAESIRQLLWTNNWSECVNDNIALVRYASFVSIYLFFLLTWLKYYICTHRNRWPYSRFIKYNTSSKSAQAAVLLTCVWEVPGLNLGRDTDHPGRGSSWFAAAKCRRSTLKVGHDRFLSRCCQFVIRNHPTIWWSATWLIYNFSKQTPPHLTSCTPTKSNLYFENSSATVLSEPAL